MAQIAAMRLTDASISKKSSSASADKFVLLSVVRKDGTAPEMVAELDQVKEAIRESKLVGRFDLIPDGGSGKISVIVERVHRRQSDGRIVMEMREVALEDAVRVEVPVVCDSVPESVEAERVVLERARRFVRIKARAGDLPDAIHVDLADAKPDDTIRAGDLALPPGVELISPADLTIFHLRRIGRAN